MGDEMLMLWLSDMPWPLANREYVMERRIAELACELLLGLQFLLQCFSNVEDLLVGDHQLLLQLGTACLP